MLAKEDSNPAAREVVVTVQLVEAWYLVRITLRFYIDEEDPHRDVYNR